MCPLNQYHPVRFQGRDEIGAEYQREEHGRGEGQSARYIFIRDGTISSFAYKQLHSSFYRNGIYKTKRAEWLDWWGGEMRRRAIKWIFAYAYSSRDSESRESRSERDGERDRDRRMRSRAALQHRVNYKAERAPALC